MSIMCHMTALFPRILFIINYHCYLRFAPVVKRPMSGKRQYMSAMENGYDEMNTQRRNTENRQHEQNMLKSNSEPVDHFPVSREDVTALDALSLIQEEGAGSLVTPQQPSLDYTEGGTSVTIKKQNGTEV